MEHAKQIRLKERELAMLENRMSDRRSTIERELAGLDEWAQREREKLEQQIHILQQAARIEEEMLSNAKVSMKGYTKQEREELFEIRKQVMRRLLQDAHGREVHSRELASVLDRPLSTVNDYYSEQLEIRPQDCFWEHGIDKAHFRWKGGIPPSSAVPCDAG